MLLGALAYGASIVLYVRGAQQLGAVRAQLVFSSAPFFGAAIAWLALREDVHEPPVTGGHVHEHAHDAASHSHTHRPDLHHRHDH